MSNKKRSIWPVLVLVAIVVIALAAWNGVEVGKLLDGFGTFVK